MAIDHEVIVNLTKIGINFSIVKDVIYYHEIEDYKAAQKYFKQMGKQAFSKYGAKKVKLRLQMAAGRLFEGAYQFVTFDSEDECDYYYKLKDDLDFGTISEIVLHPRLTLIPAFQVDGVKYGAMVYTPDFLISYPNGKKLYIDVKGMSTVDADMRRKMYMYYSTLSDRPYYGVPLLWVASNFKHGDKDGWIEYDQLQQVLKEQAKAKKEKDGAKYAKAI